MLARVLLLVLTIALVLCGCAKPEERLIGTWNGQANLKMPPTGDAEVDAAMAKVQKPVDYTFEFRADKTYTEVFPQVKIEGSWSLEGGAVTLTPKTIDGEPPEKRRKEWEEMTKKMQISMPPPEGTEGPQSAMLSSDSDKLTIRLPRGNIELTKVKASTVG